jgi:hypothetical protein
MRMRHHGVGLFLFAGLAWGTACDKGAPESTSPIVGESVDDAAAPSAAAQRSKFVGARTHDMLLEPPEGASVSGERVLDSAHDEDGANHLGLVVAQHLNGPWALWLDHAEPTEDGMDFVVRAELVLPDVTDIEHIGWEECRGEGPLADVPAGHLVGVFGDHDPGACEDPGMTPERAWVVSEAAPFFAPTDAAHVRCMIPRCRDDRLAPTSISQAE